MLITSPDDTRTQATEERYRVVAGQQFNRFERERRTAVFPENIPLFIDWLATRRPDILPKTWRQYKNAVAFVLEEKGYTDEAGVLRALTSDGCKMMSQNTQKQTSSLKKKNITRSEEDTITEYFIDRQEISAWARPCVSFFKAGLLVGLRPSEWPGVKLFVEGPDETFPAYPVLRIANGKATNGRAHGKYRHLVLDSLSDKEMTWVRLAITYARDDSTQGLMMPKGKAKDFEEYYEGLRKEFARAIIKLYPKKEPRISLYSCRHQFSANIKYAKYSLAEVAAVMGHATDDTASAHYGRKRYGLSKKGLPRPINEEVQRIRAVFEGRPEQDKTVTQSPSPNGVG
ncbi:MAG: hypothetical protein K0U41_08855 [Gammaproteobacteria bacterium]|nr:hypothetical protein [Gammaproteobacteria bacterium]